MTILKLKIIYACAGVALLVGCSQEHPANYSPAPIPAIQLLPDLKMMDADSLVKGLRLTGHQEMQSGDGRLKQRWYIAGLPEAQASLEIIGDNQKDADLLSGHCSEYNAQGSTVFPWPEQGACRQLLRGILTNTVNQPEELTNAMITKAAAAAPTAAVHSFKDLDVELSSDGFFFLRKPSRNP